MMISNVVIINTVTSEQIELDHKKTRSYILEQVAIDPIDAAITTQDMVSMDGTNVSNVRYGTRSASVNGWIIGDNDAEISETARKINRLINPKQPISIVFNGYKLTGTATSTVVYGTLTTVLNDKMRRFYFNILCDNPLIQTEFSKQTLLANWENKFHFPLKFDLPGNKLIFGLKSVSKTVRVTNLSDVPCGLRVVFQATSEVKYPRLTDISAQTHLELNTVMSMSETIVVDGSGKYVKAYLQMPGEEKENIINLVSDDSTIPMIIPVGTSLFTYSAEENPDGLQVMLEFNPSFLEVL